MKPSAGELALIKAFTQPNTANDASLDKAVVTAFTNAGLTDRELTIILGALLVMEKVDLKDANSNFKKSQKGQLKQRGKIGRASDFKKLSDAEFENANNDDDDDDALDAKDEPFIVDTFGARGDIYGGLATKSVDKNTFNQFFASIGDFKRKPSANDYWHERILAKESATQVWANTYAKSNLKYLKDLRTSIAR